MSGRETQFNLDTIAKINWEKSRKVVSQLRKNKVRANFEVIISEIGGDIASFE